MPLHLRWRASVSASTFHAAAARLRGETLRDERLARALAEPAAALDQLVTQQFGAEGPQREAFLEQLAALSAGVENNRQLAQLALAKTLGPGRASEVLLDALSRTFLELERAVVATHPGLAEQLALRADPLRSQFEARGPGLLHVVGRITEPELMVEQATVVLVHPVLGGGGRAHLPYNTVRIEAVLANPHDGLPEAVRLGWLLAQLHQDVPRYSEHLPPADLPRLAALALVPPTLQAAEEVELVHDYRERVVEALAAWQIPGGAEPGLAPPLLQWWQTYCDSQPRWPVALGALARLLQQS